MKSVFNPGNYPQGINLVLLLLRLLVGVFMLTHGWGKFEKLFGDEPLKFADPIGIGAPASLALTVFAEVFCSVLLILGCTTRLAVIPPAITMLVAIFIVHWGDGFGKMELALHYLVTYVTIGIGGAGKFSVDKLVYAKMTDKK